MINALLKVENLSLWIKKGRLETQILSNLNFCVRPEQILGLAGESGAGKSMTMYALAGLLPEKSTRIAGKILYLQDDGKYIDLLEIPYKNRTAFCSEKISLILQDSINALNPYMKVKKQWTAVVKLFYREWDREKINRHLLRQIEIFGMKGGAEILEKYPCQLSGGMRQRIAIAMALESSGKLLIADEPTTSLDTVNQRKTVEFIRKICEDRKMAMIYISHNLGILHEISSRLLVMKDGKIIEKGKTEEIFAAPSEPYTRELIGEARNLLEKNHERDIIKS